MHKVYNFSVDASERLAVTFPSVPFCLWLPRSQPVCFWEVHIQRGQMSTQFKVVWSSPSLKWPGVNLLLTAYEAWITSIVILNSPWKKRNGKKIQQLLKDLLAHSLSLSLLLSFSLAYESWINTYSNICRLLSCCSVFMSSQVKDTMFYVCGF